MSVSVVFSIFVAVLGDRLMCLLCFGCRCKWIETGHSVNENIGLKKFVEILKQHYSEMVFFSVKDPETYIR